MSRISISSDKSNIGIYVISSDESLLQNVNRMMKRKGIIGVTDTLGRINYLVDARGGRKQSREDVNSVIFSQVKISNEYDNLINSVLASHGFNLALIGSSIMLYIIRALIANNDNSHSNLKFFASEAADTFNMSANTVKRDVRYAIKNSDYANTSFRTSLIIYLLVEEVKEAYEKGIKRVDEYE